jgi:hypothetical protein
MILHRHVCIVFLSNPPIAISNFAIVRVTDIGNFPKTLLLVSWAKIQYTRDGEEPKL